MSRYNLHQQTIFTMIWVTQGYKEINLNKDLDTTTVGLEIKQRLGWESKEQLASPEKWQIWILDWEMPLKHLRNENKAKHKWKKTVRTLHKGKAEW